MNDVNQYIHRNENGQLYFPEYKLISPVDSEDGRPHNMFLIDDVGFGGYVYAEPGMYGHVRTYDVASMHPSSIREMNCFGKYTKRFTDLLDARILIKHKDYEGAGELLNGALKPYLKDPEDAKSLAQALKIAINSVYGLTSASFDNPFRDIRNTNNIVALRGALFMANLKRSLQEQGVKVVHIKTDSIKILDPTEEIENYILDFGKEYGYVFEVEADYEKICLVNDAVYIAKHGDDEEKGTWEAKGAQFQQPYVFKTLFSKENIKFEDMCETKSVSTALYLVTQKDDETVRHFVGKVGQFCPILPDKGGAQLMREKDGRFYAATGSKGYYWLESEMVKKLKKQKDIDTSYYEKMVVEAEKAISKFGDLNWFCS